MSTHTTVRVKGLSKHCIQSPTRHIAGHFRDEPFQTTDCTGTDNQKQGNKTLHIRNTQKPALANTKY